MSSDKKQPTLKLTYFNGRGRAEVLRYIMEEGKLAYEDVRIDGKDWPKLKESTPFGQLPTLDVDGTLLAQSSAIMRYLAGLAGLTGSSALEAAQADMIVEALHDTAKNFMAAAFTKDADEKKTKFATYFKDEFPKHATNLEKLLKNNNKGEGYFVGKDVTYADIFFFYVFDSISGANKDALKDYSTLSSLHERVGKRDRIAAWIAKRPKSDF